MDQPTTARRSSAKKTTWGGLALAVLIALYSFARPGLNERMGWDLPAVTGNGPVVADSERPESTSSKPTPTKTSAGQKPLAPGPLAGKVPKPASTPTSTEIVANPKATMPSAPAKPVAAELSKPASNSPVKTADPDLLYGLLKDLGGDRYITPAGLMFTRGSAEGHRLDHLERHTEDDPSRPGKHGVFDGGMEGALKTIDRAYERAKTGSRTTKEVDQGRTIYTVDMGGRVGYVGGRDGNRQNKPMARRVRLVLDQNRVITAFPL